MKHWTFFLVIVLVLTVLSCTASPSRERRTATPQAPSAVEPPASQQPVEQAAPAAETPVVEASPVEQAEPPVEQAAEQEPAAEPSPVEPPEAPPPAAQPEPVVEPVPDVQAEPVEQAAPEPQPELAPPEPVVEEVEPEEPVFAVTQEVFDTAKADIQHLVQDLNRIIRAQDFNTWLTYLSDEYRNRVNSKEFLDDIKARYPVFRNRINNARDYFRNVIVPSRANDRVDDIEFRSENRVTAYTLNNQGTRLRLYDLENINGSWKLILVED